MSADKLKAQEEALVKEVLRKGGIAERRRFFVSAAAQAPVAAPAPAPRRVLLKDDSRLLNIGATLRSGNYWNSSTYITPVEEFYIRNHYPTPLTHAVAFARRRAEPIGNSNHHSLTGRLA